MNIKYLLRKIENFFIKKQFNYPKTIVDFINNNKRITVLSFSSIGRGRKYIQKNEFSHLSNKYNVLFKLLILLIYFWDWLSLTILAITSTDFIFFPGIVFLILTSSTSSWWISINLFSSSSKKWWWWVTFVS